MGLSLKEFSRIALVIEEERLKELPDLPQVAPMLGKDISRVEITTEMIYGKEVCSNGLIDTVE
jgi:hypothetical protein